MPAFSPRFPIGTLALLLSLLLAHPLAADPPQGEAAPLLLPQKNLSDLLQGDSKTLTWSSKEIIRPQNETSAGLSQENAEAFLALRRAAEQGNSHAQFQIAYMLIEGNGVPKNESLGLQWLEKSLEQDNLDAKSYKGYLYFKGILQPRGNALQLLKDSAQKNHLQGQFFLALMYLHGDEAIERNPEESARWMKKAAEQGHPDAQCYLGMCYLFGIGVAEDSELASEWTQKAFANGSNELARFYTPKDMPPIANPSEALQALHAEGEKGNPEVQYILFSIHMNGIGVPENQDEAIKWLRKAAQQGDARSQYLLSYAYAKGEGVPQNSVESLDWYVKAYKNGIRIPLVVPFEKED